MSALCKGRNCCLIDKLATVYLNTSAINQPLNKLFTQDMGYLNTFDNKTPGFYLVPLCIDLKGYNFMFSLIL